MKVILQRVSEASVTVGEQITGSIGPGLVALVGIAPADDDTTLATMATKVTNLRIFEDDDGKMNLSVLDVAGAILAVSQFTLFADTRKGRRPSFLGAAPPSDASILFDRFVDKLRATGTAVETGIFQAMMDVRLTNHGPVTIILDSNDWTRP